MKREEREIQRVEKKVVYIAADGKEFATEDLCREWEKSYMYTLETSFKTIPHIEVEAINAYLPYGSDDHEAYVIKPRNFDDIVVINAFVEMVTCGYKTDLTQDDIGKIIMLNFGYDRDYCDVYYMEDHLQKIKTTYENFVAKLNETETN